MNTDRHRFYRLLPLFASIGVQLGFHSSALAQFITPDELAQVKQAEQARIKIVEQVYPTVVAMYPKSRQGGGSGVCFDEEGFVLTNNHVMAPIGEEGFGGLSDTKLYKLTLIGIDPTGDVAIARLHGKPKFAAAPLGDSRTVRAGDWCMAMGNPFVLAEDHRPTVTLGVVSGVERYQRGAGGNIGVYGNCIQLDASINPGNSGGPLFNMAGEVVGINGRGSFEERARVNVGLGYAISIEQIKRFMPDLRAAKICLHGTLDATFGDREGKVVCEQINLDAPIARLGMGLGDQLLSIDGQSIATANQVANLISTYPANWPVEVAFIHEGAKKTVWVRLRALPIAAQRTAPRPRPVPMDPGTRRAVPVPPPATAPALRGKPGEIRDMKLNREECDRILRKWRAFSGEATALGNKAIASTEEILIDGKKAGRQRCLRLGDGRFRIDIVEGYNDLKPGDGLGFDGQSFWHKSDGKLTTLAAADARKRPEVMQALAGAAFQQDAPKGIKDLVLEGGDRAQGQIAYRVRLTDDAGQVSTWWFSLLDPGGAAFETRLLKCATEGPSDADPMWTFADYRKVGDMMLPHRRTLVTGLDEKPQVVVQTTAAEILDAPAAAIFGGPDAK